jgi:hypothetical protein
MYFFKNKASRFDLVIFERVLTVHWHCVTRVKQQGGGGGGGGGGGVSMGGNRKYNMLAAPLKFRFSLCLPLDKTWEHTLDSTIHTWMDEV